MTQSHKTSLGEGIRINTEQDSPYIDPSSITEDGIERVVNLLIGIKELLLEVQADLKKKEGA